MFLFVLKKADKNDYHVAYCQKLETVFSRELASVQHNQFFYRDGAEETEANHPYMADLDIFGKKSLFHLLNRCHTSVGYEKLVKQLSNPPSDISHILRRQEAIKELQEKKDFLFHLLASLSVKENKNDKNNILSWLQQSNTVCISKTMLFFIYILPFFNVFLLIMSLFYSPVFSILLAFVLLQGILFHRFDKPVHAAKKDLNAIIAEVAGYQVYTDAVGKMDFQSTWLHRLYSEIVAYKSTTNQLFKMLSVFDRGDSFIGFFSNVLLFSHLKTFIRLEKWKAANREILPKLIDSISEWETIVSLTIFAINHPQFTFPEILQEASSTIMEACYLGHPLISEKDRINNNITIHGNEIFIITGANMTGKSTFLRTVGVNLLLAKIGAPVCASVFRFVPISFFTSMRTIDNLESGISYFYAEAIRIKQMLEHVASGKKYLLLMDELFRGTNSDDRLKSSLSFIRKLINYPEITALIATHDLGLTILETECPGKVKNFCFECQQQGEQMQFDYQLKRGISLSYNAYQLLKQMQIVD
jgi:DNA mismatch repair ATPase MutS